MSNSSLRRNFGDMWLQILCGLVVFRCFRRFFFDDDLPPVQSADSDSIFHVAGRLEKLYGGKVYVGLRIPDAESGSRQTIDMVLVTKGAALVIAVRGFSGFLDMDNDGSWICKPINKRRTEKHPNPVDETKRQVAILEAYLAQRGLTLPEGYLTNRVVLPNPTCRPTNSQYFLPEVISSEQWMELKPEPRSVLPNWIKDTFRGGKNEMQDGIHQQIHFILSTAPMWDRLELKGDRSILGQFSDFKGTQEDMQALMNVKRSKVSRLIIQRTSVLRGLGSSHVHVLYSPRDYRIDGASASELKEVTVRSSTEVIFQPINSKKPQRIKLCAIVSASFST